MNTDHHTIDITEAASLAFLCVMQASSPVDSNVALLAVQTGGSFHRATGADSTELEETVEDRTIVTNIVLGLLTHVTIHIVGCNSSEEIDILVGVELGHFIDDGGLRALCRFVALAGHPH